MCVPPNCSIASSDCSAPLNEDQYVSLSVTRSPISLSGSDALIDTRTQIHRYSDGYSLGFLRSMTTQQGDFRKDQGAGALVEIIRRAGTNGLLRIFFMPVPPDSSSS